MNQKVYDYIVIGASIPGIVFAVQKSRRGSSVLLTNMYGFPGGSISEQLNCYQEADAAQFGNETQKLYRSIITDNFERTVVNPETVKYVLQEAMTGSTADLYYHVVPKNIIQHENGIFDVFFLAKEGELLVSGKNIFDATEDYSAAVLYKYQRTVKERFFHLFASRPSNEAFLSFNRIRKAIRLSDGRYWISLQVESTNDLFAENDVHDLVDTFRIVLEQSNSRIQVLPLGVQTIFTVRANIPQNSSFMTIDQLAGSSYKPFDLFHQASIIEQLER